PVYPLFPYTTLFRSSGLRKGFTSVTCRRFAGSPSHLAKVHKEHGLPSLFEKECRNRAFWQGVCSKNSEPKSPGRIDMNKKTRSRDRKSTRLNSSHEW